MTTSAVQFTGASNNWTGQVDVTACSLDSDLSVKDLDIYYDGVQQGTTEMGNWVKTSQTILTYSGSNVDLGTIVIIHRKTTTTQYRTVAPNEVIRSAEWNAEMQKNVRWKEEVEAFGVVPNTISATVSDTAYGASWDGITVDAPSKNSVYDKMEIVNTRITQTLAGTIAESIPILRNTMGGRLCVSSTNPYAWATSSGTLYYTPIPRGSGFVSLYEGSKWRLYPLTSAVSLSLAALNADTTYDVFLHWDGAALELATNAWSSAQSRGIGKLVFQDGVFVLQGATSYRYVGCIRTDGSKEVSVKGASAYTEDIVVNISNFYNRYRDKFYGVNTHGDYAWTHDTYGITRNQDSTFLITFLSEDATTVGIDKELCEMTMYWNFFCSDTVGLTNPIMWYKWLETVSSTTVTEHPQAGMPTLSATVICDIAGHAHLEPTKLPTGINGWQMWKALKKVEITHTGTLTLTGRDSYHDNILIKEW